MEHTHEGKIIKGVGGLYTVRLLDDSENTGARTVSCRARGSFRHQHLSPLPGDIVTVIENDTLSNANDDESGGRFVIDAIKERKNALIRPPMANLDILFITMAASAPAPVLSTVDKLIAIAEHNHIEPVIVITKCELDPDFAEELGHIYRLGGFRTFVLSAECDTGIAPISEFIEQELKEKTAAFAGASGIGKSTLLNRLFPDLSLSTHEISRKIQRGRHTTRQVELFALSSAIDSGYIADTPGFSMLDFERFDFFDKEDLPEAMREFRPLIGCCRYTKCSHTKEDGCAILEAVKNGEIAPSRHESYVEIYNILKQKKKWS